jgi:hypothetical protein
MKGVKWRREPDGWRWLADVGHFRLGCTKIRLGRRSVYKGYVAVFGSARSGVRHAKLAEAKRDAEQRFVDLLETLRAECCEAMLRVGMDPEVANEGR